MVIGKKNCPTAAYTGRKRQLKWPPYTGGYKYGELALPVTGMSTGRQSVNVKKKAARKTELWRL